MQGGDQRRKHSRRSGRLIEATLRRAQSIVDDRPTSADATETAQGSRSAPPVPRLQTPACHLRADQARLPPQPRAAVPAPASPEKSQYPPQPCALPEQPGSQLALYQRQARPADHQLHKQAPRRTERQQRRHSTSLRIGQPKRRTNSTCQQSTRKRRGARLRQSSANVPWTEVETMSCNPSGSGLQPHRARRVGRCRESDIAPPRRTRSGRAGCGSVTGAALRLDATSARREDSSATSRTSRGGTHSASARRRTGRRAREACTAVPCRGRSSRCRGRAGRGRG